MDQKQQQQQERFLSSMQQQQQDQQQQAAQQAAFRQFPMLGGGLPQSLAEVAAGGSHPFQSSSLLDAQSSAAAGATDSAGGAGAAFAGDQLGAAAASFLPLGMSPFNPSMLPFGASAAAAAQDPLLRANLSLLQQQAANMQFNNPFGAAAAGLFNGFSAYPPLGVPGLTAADKRGAEQMFLEGFHQQQPFQKKRKLSADKGTSDEAKAVAEAVGGITAFASSFGGTKTAFAAEDDNFDVLLKNTFLFPLPHAKHERKREKPSLSAFRKKWNAIQTKGLRKELFSRSLYRRNFTRNSVALHVSPWNEV